MKDGIIKGEGNSRLLKGHSSIPATYADFRSALLAGTLLVDLLYNAAGWDVEGTALNKANLLTDAVAEALGLESIDPTVNEAINALLAVATQTKNGMMSAEDKGKLDGVAENANNYVHPTTAGNKHIPAGGNVDSILGYSASGTAIWIQQLAIKALLSTTTANIYGLSGTGANVDVLMADFPLVSSYQAFCTAANSDSLDAAFGKNNEENIKFVGKQMALYSWFKGDSKVSYPFTGLKTRNTFANCYTNSYSEIRANTNLLNLIFASPYARDACKSYIPMPGNYPIKQTDQQFITKIASDTLSTIIVPKNGYYRVKFKSSTSTFENFNFTISLNGSTLHTVSSDKLDYSSDIILKAGDVISASVNFTADNDHRGVICSPIMLCTSRPIGLPTTPADGNVVVLSPNFEILYSERSGTTIKIFGDSSEGEKTNVTITKAGTYRIRFKVLIWTNSSYSASTFTAYIYKNGSSVYNVAGTAPSYSEASATLTGDTVLTLAAGDVLNLRGKGSASDSIGHAVGFFIECNATDDFPA